MRVLPTLASAVAALVRHDDAVAGSVAETKRLFEPFRQPGHNAVKSLPARINVALDEVRS